MSKGKILSYAVMTIISSTALAGAMGETKTCPDLGCMPWFVEFGTGVSWSTKSHINPDPSRWDPANEGYNSTLGNEPLYMAGIGYTINPLLSVDANYTFRGIYKYRKHQTALGASAVNPLGNKTRYFDLISNSLMFSGTLYGQGWSESLAYSMGNYGIIQPFLGGGVGVAYNTVSNFRTVTDNTNFVTSVLQDYTKASFAWQLNAGLELKKNRFGLDLGYRYFNAGSFLSNNALITRVNSVGTPITTNLIPAWSSNLSANELYLTAKIAF
ncbi:TPA: hypothetical protein JD751_001333 [Legionella pneumophila subsp. pneumophila]|uniref:outer membrane protein n=1 Tax=Legionella pneumophila TaxID=446 RepID=UPI00077869F8|nr:hypothetical protein [Legionella pneumophila]HCC3235703.1 hypothetical protein [Legionella pneumophila subsp. pneumophila]HAT8622063.1 hypothetical protein [Legionella pneumophila]HAU9853985.1 hypothetical protein [Legionella pneumophila]HAU9907555.1 hypothetical protein [Legionella pneumophila]HAV0028434.1 hypothetical protein [Legionella pneumophila]